MKRIFFISLLIGTCFQISQAQIKVSSTNNVGIGVDNPLSKLSIGNSGNTISKVYIENSGTIGQQRALHIYQLAPTYTPGNDCGYGGISIIDVSSAGYKHAGFFGRAYSNTALTTGRTYGLMGIAGNASNGYNYGVYGQLLGSNNGAALYGVIASKTDPTIAGKYAAYLNGPVLIVDSLKVGSLIRCQSLIQTSDITLKKNITGLPTGNLEKVSKLNGITYQFLTQEELGVLNRIEGDTATAITTILDQKKPQSEKTHIGFSAQEVKEIFPDLVEADQDGLLGIDYSGLIPVLVEAIKEQQVQMEALKTEILELKSLIKP
jgi:hypothetical protein